MRLEAAIFAARSRSADHVTLVVVSVKKGRRRVDIVTRDDLITDLRDLGVEDGMVVLAHTSLSRLGNVVGGEQAVIEALLTAVGRSGTVVMPAQSWQLCDPAYLAESADPPQEMWQTIRDHLPAYDPAVTPTRTMGAVAELFRTIPGALRSGHPHRSFAAVGRMLQNHTGPIFPLLEDLFGISVVEVRQEIAAVQVSPELAEVLKVEPGSPALQMQRRYTTSDSEIAQVTVNTHPAARFRHSMTMRRVKG